MEHPHLKALTHDPPPQPSLPTTLTVGGWGVHLVAGVDVQEVGQHHESHGGGDVAVGAVLLHGGGDGDVEEQHPRDAHLRPHLEVQRPDLRREEWHSMVR